MKEGEREKNGRTGEQLRQKQRGRDCEIDKLMTLVIWEMRDFYRLQSAPSKT